MPHCIAVAGEDAAFGAAFAVSPRQADQHEAHGLCRGGAAGLAIAAAIAIAVGCWAAGTIAKTSGVKDPGAIVIDEVAAQWLVLLPAPLEPLSYAAAFLLFRIFDIWKPWPVELADRRVDGGLGIMLDDLLAAAYAVLVFVALLAIAGACGVRS